MAGMSDGDGDGDGAVFTPAPDRTKSGRVTFKNELTKRFGSKYRDADNYEKLMDELMPPLKSLWDHCRLHVWALPAN